MKTRDLIAALQEVDPSGGIEVCLGNADIHFVAVVPAYYDGCLQVLKRDESKKGCYNVVGGEFRSGGAKAVIFDCSIHDVLHENPDAPITFDSEYAKRHYAASVEEWRKEAREIAERVRAGGKR